MIVFTSDRERRFWLWALAVVVAIYSTLSVARRLSGALANSGLLGAFFVLALLLVIATIVTQGLRTRPGGAEIGVGLGITAAYLLVVVRMAIPERTHLIEYSVLAVFIYEALSERRRNGRSIPAPPLLAWVVTALLGWLDEAIQAVLPDRVYDLRDVGFNALAALMAIGSSYILAWTRRRGDASTD